MCIFKAYAEIDEKLHWLHFLDFSPVWVIICFFKPFALNWSLKFVCFPIVDDDIVIALVRKEINRMEKAADSYIIQGFPRTKVQALAIQDMKIIPDKFINLTMKEKITIDYIFNARTSTGRQEDNEEA